MSIPKVQQHAIGIPIRMKVSSSTSTPFDPEGLDVLTIVLRGPTGNVWELPAVWSGPPSDGVLERITAVGDLPEYGVHAIQGHVRGGGRDLFTRVLELNVLPNLTPPRIVLKALPLSISSAAPPAGI